jgi:prepilin peptidase CpaA
MSVPGCLALFLALGAVEMDLRSRKISNAWLAAGWLAGFCIRVMPAAGDAGDFFGGSILPLLLLAVLFRFRMLGAGDIKLLSVLGGLMGISAVWMCICWSFLFGAVFAVGILSACGSWRQRFSYFFRRIRQFLTTKTVVPYRTGNDGPECLHFSVPVLMGTLLWIGGFY